MHNKKTGRVGCYMTRLLLCAALFCFTQFSFQSAFGRTWPTKDYKNDPSANSRHVFGIYKDVPNYIDPSFNEALSIESPLNQPAFESYNVAVIIDINSKTDENTGAAIRGQTIRVYSRDSLVHSFNDGRFDKTNYDSQTGLMFYWKTSTARAGKHTPRGYYRPEYFSSDHKSSLYNNSAMPWAVFFNGHVATHGVLGNSISNLGKMASAGCARLEPQRAKDLFHLIGLAGKDWVDAVKPDGNFIFTADGKITQEINWKTLISVR